MLDVKPIPTPKGSEHPPPPNGNGLLPTHEFTMGLIAPKGQGKTTTIINLMEFYKDYFHQIWIFSPTVKSDSKWAYAKTLPLLAENKPLKKWVSDMMEKKETNGPFQNTPVGDELRSIVDLEKRFEPEIPAECFVVDHSIVSKVRKVLDENKKVVDILDDHKQLKTIADRILLICDDQVGSDLFSGPLKKYFVGANTRHRHHSASIIMVSQGYKEIPKTIRTGWTCLLLYKIGNMKELFVIFEEYSAGLKWEQWLQLYNYATAEKYHFMFIDLLGPDELKIRKDFDKVLRISDD